MIRTIQIREGTGLIYYTEGRNKKLVKNLLGKCYVRRPINIILK
jgi:hypothetical protein